MIFDFFKILFPKKEKKVPSSNEKEQLMKQLMDILEQEKSPLSRTLNPNKVVDPPKKDAKIEKPKGKKMPETYLVTLDTTNRPEVKDIGLKGGLKNFYFVYAADEVQAKDFILNTFRSRPGVMYQLSYSIKATPLNVIVGGMGKNGNFWSYIPFAGKLLPGQQSAPPLPGKVLVKNGEGEETAQGVNVNVPHDSVVGKENVVASDVMPKQAPPIPQMPQMPNGNMNPQQMMQMMQMMMTMMNQGTPAKPSIDDIENDKVVLPHQNIDIDRLVDSNIHTPDIKIDPRR